MGNKKASLFLLLVDWKQAFDNVDQITLIDDILADMDKFNDCQEAKEAMLTYKQIFTNIKLVIGKKKVWVKKGVP
jgi:hypothetical protein